MMMPIPELEPPAARTSNKTENEYVTGTSTEKRPGVRETGNDNNSALTRRRPTALNASAFDVGPGGRARLARANPATTAKGNTRCLCS
jgi:hypothetical protein